MWRSRRFLPGQRFPRRLRAGGDMGNLCLVARRRNAGLLNPRRRMYHWPREISRGRMNHRTRQKSRLGSHDRSRQKRSPGCSGQANLGGSLPVGIAPRIAPSTDCTNCSCSVAAMRLGAGDRRHAVQWSKHHRQARASFAPAIKNARNIAWKQSFMRRLNSCA